MDAAHISMLAHTVYTYLITNFGNINSDLKLLWSTSVSKSPYYGVLTHARSSFTSLLDCDCHYGMIIRALHELEATIFINLDTVRSLRALS